MTEISAPRCYTDDWQRTRPDRKHFLLGKVISDTLLEQCGEVPGDAE